MTNAKGLARQLAHGAAAYRPADEKAAPANENEPRINPRTTISEAEQRNTAKLRAAAFEATRDERQIDLL